MESSTKRLLRELAIILLLVLFNFSEVDAEAVLHSTLSVSSAQVEIGEKVTITLTVQNVGNATALEVYPQINITGSASFFIISYQKEPLFIDVGKSVTFIEVIQVAGEGSLFLTGNATGMDARTKKLVSSKTSSVSISVAPKETPAPTFSISLSISPAAPSIGEEIIVAMEVTNTGKVTVVEAAPILVPGGIAPVSVVSSASRGITIRLGETYIFTEIVKANGEGSLYFTGYVEGFDNRTGKYAKSSAATSNTVVITPALPTRLEIKADPVAVPADGTSKSTIIVVLVDRYGKPIPARSDIEITLSTTSGTIQRRITIPKGSASGEATLTSPISFRGKNATVSATSGELTRSIEVEFAPLIPFWVVSLLGAGSIGGTMYHLRREGKLIRVKVQSRAAKTKILKIKLSDGELFRDVKGRELE